MKEITSKILAIKALREMCACVDVQVAADGHAIVLNPSLLESKQFIEAVMRLGAREFRNDPQHFHVYTCEGEGL